MLKLILLLNPVYVTLFWAVVLSFYSENKGAPKAFLGKFMGIAFIVYFSHFLYFSGQTHIYRHIDSIYTFASLLVFPLYHIYIRLLTVDNKFSFTKHFIYLLPPTIVFVLHTIGLQMLNADEQLDFFREVLPGLHHATGNQIFMMTVFYIGRVVFITQIFIYLFLNFKLLIKNRQQVEHFYSNTDSMSLSWVQFFNISLGIISIASILVAIAGREAFTDSNLTLALPSLVFSTLLFFIGLLGNNQITVHTPIADPLSARNGESESALHAIALKSNMEKLFVKEKIFKNADLKIWDVCQMLGSNRTYVSKLINSEYNRNFCNHVNYYRVEYAKELIDAKPDISNDEIVELAGFGSLNSLYRAFQTFEGIPLKHYRK